MKKNLIIILVGIVIIFLGIFLLVSNQKEKSSTEDGTESWIKCVGSCDFYFNDTLGEILKEDCLDTCTGRYKISPEYEGLDSAILYLSAEIKICKNTTDSFLAEKCLKGIPDKYLIN